MSSVSIYSIPGVRAIQRFGNHLTSYIPPPPNENSDSDGTPSSPRNILVVNAHPVPTSFSRSLADTFVKSSEDAGHEVKRITITDAFQSNMTRSERTLYTELLDSPEEKQRTLSREVKAHIDLLKWCDTLVFIYPTWWMNTPAALKGWFDRTMIPPSSWDFPDPQHKGAILGLVPKLNNVKQIVGITTYGATQMQVTLAGDNGRRMISNAVRHSVCPQATVLWMGLYGMDFLDDKSREQFLEEVKNLPKEL